LLGGFFGLDDLLFLAGLFIFPLILFFVCRFVSKDVIFGLHGLIFRLRLFNFEQSLQVGGDSALDVKQLVFCLEGSLGRLEGTVADKAKVRLDLACIVAREASGRNDDVLHLALSCVFIVLRKRMGFPLFVEFQLTLDWHKTKFSVVHVGK